LTGARLAREEEAVAARTMAAISRRRRLLEALTEVRRLARAQSGERLGLAAAGAAFWMVVAVFPATLAAVSIFGLVTSPGQVARELASVAAAGPDSLGSFASTQLRHVAATDRARLSAGLAVSVGLALWSTSAGVYNLERALRTAYRLPVGRYVTARGRALLGAVAVVTGLGALALASAAVTDLFDRTSKPLEAVVGVPMALVLLTAMILGMYRFAIRHGTGLRELLPGAAGSAAAIVVLIGGLDVYLRFSTHITAVYGAFAGVVLAMLFAYVSIYAVLLGAVLNAELQRTGRGSAT
jgi:membrane protein